MYPQGQWPKWIKNIANKIKKEIEKVVNIVTIAIKATTKNQQQKNKTILL